MKLYGKHQAHLLKIKGKKNYKERGCTNISINKQECLDQRNKLKTEELLTSQKNRKKKTCCYYGNVGHVEKTCWKKTSNLEEKVKQLEGDVVVV